MPIAHRWKDGRTDWWAGTRLAVSLCGAVFVKSWWSHEIETLSSLLELAESSHKGPTILYLNVFHAVSLMSFWTNSWVAGHLKPQDAHVKWWWWSEQPLVVSYRKVSNIRRTLVGNKIVDHSDVVGASPVGAAPTTSSFSTWHLAL